MFPMQLYLKTPPLPKNYTISVLQFIRSYFKQTKLNNFFILNDILSYCLMMIGKRSISIKVSNDVSNNLSKELKVSLCECLEKLLISSDPKILEQFFSQELQTQPESPGVFMSGLGGAG